MTFGLQPQGLVIQRLADVLDTATAAFRAEFSDNVDLANDAPHGQLRGIVADIAALLWELLDQIYQGGFMAGASGVTLDQVLALGALKRLPARATRTSVTIAGTPGTPIPAGSLMSTADTAVRFASITAFTIPASGSGALLFDCTTTGPTPCLAGTLTVISTPIVGWTSGTNALDGSVGADIESDSAYKVRRLQALNTVLSASSPGVMLSVLKINGVLEAKLIENLSSISDGDGRPPHSYELAVRGGSDTSIQAAMFATKPAGIRTVGNVSGTVIDSHQDPQPINFSRPVEIPIYFIVDLVVSDKFPTNGEALVRAAILSYGQGQLPMGSEIVPFQIEQTIETPGILTFDMRLDIGPGPVNKDPLIMGALQIGAFDSTRLITRVVRR